MIYRSTKICSYSIFSASGNVLAISRDSIDKECIVNFCKEFRTDGFLLLSPSSKADYSVDIFNSDGSTAGMCGNGLRAIALYLSYISSGKNTFFIETFSGIYFCGVVGKKAFFDIDKVNYKEKKIFIKEYGEIVIYIINTGVPHAVILCNKDKENIDVNKVGRLIRYHEEFSPEGINVTFVFGMEKNEKNNFFFKTYERGVEAETGACGTGIAAGVFVLDGVYSLNFPVKILSSSRSEFLVSKKLKSRYNILGEVERLCEGTFFKKLSCKI